MEDIPHDFIKYVIHTSFTCKIVNIVIKLNTLIHRLFISELAMIIEYEKEFL